MSIAINKAVVRRFALDVAASRYKKKTRVSVELFDKADAALKRWLVQYVESLPSAGKTIK